MGAHLCACCTESAKITIEYDTDVPDVTSKVLTACKSEATWRIAYTIKSLSFCLLLGSIGLRITDASSVRHILVHCLLDIYFHVDSTMRA